METEVNPVGDSTMDLTALYLEASALAEILTDLCPSVPLFDLDPLLSSSARRRLRRIVFAYRSYLHMALLVHDHDILVSRGYSSRFDEEVLSVDDPHRVITLEELFWSPLINNDLELMFSRLPALHSLKNSSAKETDAPFVCGVNDCAFCQAFGLEDEEL